MKGTLGGRVLMCSNEFDILMDLSKGVRQASAVKFSKVFQEDETRKSPAQLENIQSADISPDSFSLGA
jgi:hypothetical protein